MATPFADRAARTGLDRWAAVLATMLSLSIGWGIRGNFGHEYGAMLPGALSALAVCICSGREDWWSRAPFFAMFGALGWAFGGSMAYMPPLGYTHSGHLPTQIYGWLMVFCIGGFWTALGVAGTAYAATEERSRLEEILQPISFVLAIWTVHYFWPEGSGDFRQRNPLYWLDSDWVEASLALVALCVFDLWDRRFRRLGLLAAFSATGALAGFGLQQLLNLTGLMRPFLDLVVRYQGDPAVFGTRNLVTNWPELFTDIAPHLGWLFGAIAGLAVYFTRYGAWRKGSSLLVHITAGSLLVFFILPVLLGIRMVPPRGDSWAMTLGAILGLLLYMQRHRRAAVVSATLTGLVLGGLALMIAQFLKILAFMPGNPVLTQNAAAIQWWAHWHSSNWHSIAAEQGAGLLYGLALLIAMRPLATRPAASPERLLRPWTTVFAAVFVLNLIPYLNLVKNVGVWTRERAAGFRAMPPAMKPPLFGPFDVPALVWFNIAWLLILAATIVALTRHVRRPLACVPESWLGKAQLIWCALLWVMVIGNFERALVGFTERRLATEGFITLNAVIATVIILIAPRRETQWKQAQALPPRRMLALGFMAMLLATAAFTTVVRSFYGDRHDGWGRRDLRFGSEAAWRVRPLLKNVEHR
jgi:hypothetical protein